MAKPRPRELPRRDDGLVIRPDRATSQPSRRLLLADTGDTLGEALAAALGHSLPDSSAAASPVELVRSSETEGAPPEPGDTLLLVPARTTPSRTDDGDLSPSDRGLLSLLRRWQESVDGGRLILLSSSLVHQASHRQPGHVPETALPRRPPAERVPRRWRRLEEEVGPDAVVLRPTPIAIAGGDDLFSRLLGGHLLGGRLHGGRFHGGHVSAVPAGFDPPLQLLSLDELMAALLTAITAEEIAPGPWHLAPDGVIPLRQALRAAGVRPLPLPTFVLRLMQRLRGEAPDAVEALRYPVTVSDAAWRRHTAVHLPTRPPATLDRNAGELEHDPFSLDRPYIDRLGRTLFRFLHDRWWRIEWRGLENVPRSGGAVLVGNHRGHQPWDGVMLLHRLARDLGRYPRFLIHPALVKFPFLAPYMSRCGGLHACRENGDWVLSQEELLAVFPEGIRGAFLRYRESRKLVTFRPDYVRFALRHQVPIVPITIVGSAEIFPILGKLDWKWWKRLTEWPTLPITPTASLLPLPSKWHIEVLEPIDVAAKHGPEAADDPVVYRRINAQVRRRMAENLEALYRRRPGIFRGSIFQRDDSAPLGDRT